MNKRLHLSLTAACLGIGMSALALAEDIDIYTVPPSALAAPNVLMILDNTSNWAANLQGWTYTDTKATCGGDAVCIRYVDLVFAGDAGPLAQGVIEARTLKVVLNELACTTGAPSSVNLGLMMFSDAGTAAATNTTGAYVRRAVQFLGPNADGKTGCTNVLADLDDISTNITAPRNKINSSGDYGAAMFEAFKYFGGYANTNGIAATVGGTPADSTHFGPKRYSNLDPKSFTADPAAFVPNDNTTYLSPITANSCGNNYILFIGNAFPKIDFGTDTKASPPTNSIMLGLGLKPSQLPDTVNTPVRFADEWAQFLSRTDVSDVAGQQPLKTFTINVFNKDTPDQLNQAPLLNSMAVHGGTGAGGAFIVKGNIKALVDAIKQILTQINSVNNSFASASLPISVNTQGTYLNQVFIGMFRPAPNAFPRWAGNLKQYQFALRQTVAGSVTTRTLFLADASVPPKPAVDNANTGFIDGCATSFWTHDSGTYWNSVTNTTPSHDIPGGSCLLNPASVDNDSPDGRVVERGGAAQKLRDISTVTSRTISTCDAAPANCTAATAKTLTPSTTVEKWIQGANVGDGYNFTVPLLDAERYGKTADTVMRPTVHGGVIHSRPLAINYGANGVDDVVVFYGADDGFFRAADGNRDGAASNGSELWAFLAPEFNKLDPTGKSRLARNQDNYPHVTFNDDPTAPKDFFFDGSIGAYIGPANADGTGSAVTYIYPSMRRGGRMIYAFDATKRPSSATPPTPLWRFGCDSFGNCVGTDAATLGQTWSAPRVVRVKGQTALYTVFGGGYDDCEDQEPRTCTATSRGQGIFVLDANTGALIRHIDLGAAAGRIAADLVPIDTDGDGFFDLIYAADTSGNVWRINLTDPSKVSVGQTAADWKVTQVAKVGDWTTTNPRNRKFLYAPDVVRVGKYNIVLIGSGNREKPLNTSAAAKTKNRFYGFWDEYAVIGTGTGKQTFPIDDSNDCDLPNDTSLSPGCNANLNLLNTSTTTLDYLPVFSSEATRPRGWVIDLTDTSDAGPNEQVVTTPATVGGLVNFSTFQAKNKNICSSLGTARGYAACFLDGGATCGSIPPDGTLRSAEFVGGGLPPSPVTGTVLVDGKIVPFIIGGKPDAGGGSAIEVKLPPIPIKKDRTKVYRYKKID